MGRFFTRAFAGVLLLVVAGLSAFVALRIAIHGREVSVPNLAGLSDADAARTAKELGLNLAVENRFFSVAIAPNHVLSQSPAPGSRVRRGWPVRVTESLGGEKTVVPDLRGADERAVGLQLRRLQLEPGSIAHLPLPAAGRDGDQAPIASGVVLAQFPPGESTGLNGPRVDLLVAGDPSPADAPAYVMPSLVGLTLAGASARLATAGLHIASSSDPVEDALTPDATPAGTELPFPESVLGPRPVNARAVIQGQSPAAGHRVTAGDAIRVILAH